MALQQNEETKVFGCVLAIRRRETCCMYTVADEVGNIAELKRRYMYHGQQITVEDGIL
jgi:hypothetical protein